MKIDRPGVYDLSIEEYLGDCCVGPSISSSGLREILLGCPAKYWAFSPLNPNAFPDESTKALDVGRAAHALALGEPEFAKYFVISPYDAFNKKPGYTWYNDEWKPAVESGREKRALLKPDDFEEVKAVAAVQKRSAQVMRAFEQGRPERSLVWQDAVTGIWCKARPDWLPDDPTTRLLAEYKTCLSIRPGKLDDDVFKYGYDMQAAMQLDGVREVMGIEPQGICHVCQEKSPPYLAAPYLFTPEQLADGQFLYRHALKIFAHCVKTGDWPGYTDQPTFFETPYRHAQLVERIRYDASIGRGTTTQDPERYSAADYAAAL